MYHIDDENLKIINDKIEEFYLNGEPVEKAPLAIKINVRKWKMFFHT